MEDENLVKPSINSTPADICGYAIFKLSEFWDDLLSLTKGGEYCVGVEGFIEDIFSRVWEDGDTGEKFESELESWEDQPDEQKPFALINVMLACCGYASQAIQSENDGNLSHAWYFTSKCEYWLGILRGAWSIRRDLGSPLKELSKIALDARHAENRSMKADVHKWLDSNMARFKSMDAAAESIAGNVAPVKWRTARSWVGEWKKLRSTGTL